MNWYFDPIIFWFVATRITGLSVAMTPFSQIPMPMMARIGIVLWLTLAIIPTLPIGAYNNIGPIDLTIGLFVEFFIGMALGFIVLMTVGTVEFAGNLVDTNIGFRTAEQLNPAFDVSSSPLTRVFTLIALGIFWMLDYTGLMILALRETFLLVPPFSLVTPFQDISQVFHLAESFFVAGLVLSAPIQAIMFAITIGVGFLARSVQGLNFLYEIFGLRILGGVACFITFLPLTMYMLRDQMGKIIPLVHLYVTSLAGRAI